MRLQKYLTEETEDIMVLDYPDIRQSDSSSCGPAVVRSVLNFFGEDEEEEKLKKVLKCTDDWGTDPTEIVKYLKKKNYKVKNHELTIDQVIDFVKKKKPVILCIQAWADKNVNYAKSWDHGHYVVAIGYNKKEKRLLFHDPSVADQRAYLEFKELLDRWHDVDRNGTKYNNFGIAVYGKKPAFRSKLVKIK